MAREGKITPIPVGDPKNDRWGGLDSRAVRVNDKDLSIKRIVSFDKIKSKYLL